MIDKWSAHTKLQSKPWTQTSMSHSLVSSIYVEKCWIERIKRLVHDGVLSTLDFTDLTLVWTKLRIQHIPKRIWEVIRNQSLISLCLFKFDTIFLFLHFAMESLVHITRI